MKDISAGSKLIVIMTKQYSKATLSERTCCEWFQRFKCGDFDVEEWHGDGNENIFEDSESEALIAEVSCQAKEEFAESLKVTQKAISERLKAMGLIQKQGNWVPYEWSRQMLNGVPLRLNSCFKDRIERGFLIASWLTMKKESTTIIPSAQNRRECPEMPPC